MIRYDIEDFNYSLDYSYYRYMLGMIILYGDEYL